MPEAPSSSQTKKTETADIVKEDVLGLTSDALPIPIIVVNPGQRITIDSEIAASRVTFSYLSPGAVEAVFDQIGQSGSKIERVSPTRVRVVIDTREMRGGDGWWYLLGEDDEHPELQVAEPGRFHVRDIPSALYRRASLTIVRNEPELGGLHMLGAL